MGKLKNRADAKHRRERKERICSRKNALKARLASKRKLKNVIKSVPLNLIDLTSKPSTLGQYTTASLAAAIWHSVRNINLPLFAPAVQAIRYERIQRQFDHEYFDSVNWTLEIDHFMASEEHGPHPAATYGEHFLVTRHSSPFCSSFERFETFISTFGEESFNHGQLMTMDAGMEIGSQIQMMSISDASLVV